MKSVFFLSISVAMLTVSCKKNLDVKKVEHDEMSSSGEKLTVQVVNSKDPICEMETKDFLKDTAVYQNKVYGFCSASCKSEFLKDPKKHTEISQ